MKVPGLIFRLGRKPDPWSVPIGLLRDRMERSAIGLTIPKGCTVFYMHPRKDLVASSKP